MRIKIIGDSAMNFLYALEEERDLRMRTYFSTWRLPSPPPFLSRD